jgi:hypothetical protein
MRKIIVFLLVIFTIANSGFSQNTVKGSIVDTSEKKNLASSVVAVLQKSDSILHSFTRSDRSGNFSLQQLPAGKYILMITHPAYADYVDEITVAPDTPLDLGKIIMTLKSQLLQEVIVSNAGAIRVKGDTTEFKVDSFHLSAGATVEDLLKKLPGIQVDRNGKITAQGEAVQKVLVDGEEFFSDDPTIITKNMLSDAIDKVQVYDKKSDQATFTGVDDGQKSKTIDLKLKANRKNGFFGKIEVGSDANKYWNNSAMLNAFKGKRKFAAFGIMSNTGKTGLDFRESMNYGTNNNVEMGFEDGGMYMVSSGGDAFDRGSFYGEGLPTGWNGGLHYSNKWDNDRINLVSNYQYKKVNAAARGNTESKYILPDTLYYVNDKGNSYSSRFRNSLNGTYEYQIDSSSSLKITASGYSGSSINLNTNYSESLDKNGAFVNTSNRRINSESDDKNVNTTLLYRKKFKKTGRTFSMNVQQNYNETASDGFLNADYAYFNSDGTIKQRETTDQQKLNDNIRSSVTSRAVYTEPLSKRAILEFSYGLSNNLGRSSITTLEKMTSTSGKYEMIIDSLSNQYSLNVLNNSAGINYRYAKLKKINFSFGGNISKADFTRKDLKSNSAVRYDFINLFPRANANITLPSGGNLSLYYSGSTRAPSIDQIQPVKDNSDNLNQRIGNPDLKQSFRQNMSINFNHFKLLSQRSFYLGINASTVSNDFSNINYVDALGRRVSQPVNVQGNYNYGTYLYYSKKIAKPSFNLGANFSFNKNHNINFINTIKNVNNSVYFNGGPRLNFQKDKKYDLTLNPGFGFNSSTSSIRPDEPTKYWTQDHYVNLTLFLPLKFEFNTDCQFNLRQKTDGFDDNNNVIRWNMRLDRKFFKKDAGILRFSAFDILDQNIGLQRNINSNFVSQRTYDTFRRYFMLSFIYNFSKNSTGPTR